MPNTWGANEITDAEADEAYNTFVDGEYDDTPDVPVGWDAGEL